MLRRKEARGPVFEGYEPKLVAAMDRSQSLPPLTPWWSERIQREAILQHRRPQDLPVPHDGDDGDLEEVAPGEGVAGSGKGRGLLTQGGRVFVTPPSRRTPEGRGGGPGRKTAGTMDEGSINKPSPPAAGRTMGPMPPEPEEAPKKRDETQGNLQRAMEAEIVVFLREQNGTSSFEERHTRWVIFNPHLMGAG